MKVLSHIYTATQGSKHLTLPPEQLPFITLGSILPEMAFYATDNPFIEVNFHESGKDITQLLQLTAPAYTGLGIGMMAHSETYGADHFNKLTRLESLGYYKDTLFLREVAEALNITNEAQAYERIHNIYHLALDLFIAETYPETIAQLANAIEDIPVRKSAELLSSYFHCESAIVE